MVLLNQGVTPTNSGIRRPGAPPERKVGSMSSYASRVPVKTLAAGQIVRGEVTDLRNREITITLEDNTSVTGKLPEGTSLSIGERASFLVTNIQPDNIQLELVKKHMRSSEDITVQKALEEAGLPITEKNQTIVKELLSNGMPIHKQSIMNIVGQTYRFPEVSIETLVAMNRLGMKVTAENAAQFENCRTRGQSLAGSAQELTKAIVSYLQENDAQHAPALAREVLRFLSFEETEFLEKTDKAPQPETVPEYENTTVNTNINTGGMSGLLGLTGFNRLASLLMPSKSSSVQAAPEEPNATGVLSAGDRVQLSETVHTFTEGQLSELDRLTQPEKPVNPMAFYQKTPEVSEELQLLLDSLHAFSEKSDALLSQETVFLRDAIALFKEGKGLADDVDFYRMGEARSRFMEKNPEMAKILEEGVTERTEELYQKLSSGLEDILEKVPVSADHFSTALLEHMESDFSVYLENQGNIAALLSEGELSELYEQAKEFPFHAQFLERLKDGDVSPKEFFTVLKNAALLVPDNTLHAMAATEGFGKLFEQSFAASFFLSPKEIEKQGKVEEFYNQTYTRLHNLSKALEQAKAGDSSSDFLDHAGQKAGDMQEQIDFLKAINEMFTYVQLPVKLKNQMQSADLYVYTKKEAMRGHPENLSMLLHLDMDHLGALDIYVALNHATVTSKFYCEDDDIKKFLSSQMSSLKTALNLKGYLFDGEIEERKRDFDFVKDFIQREEKAAGNGAKARETVKRYTFDIRA